ncbi:MAG TPA: hypothetical protein VJC13_03640 [Candidatus Paceibacterota bacterium]
MESPAAVLTEQIVSTDGVALPEVPATVDRFLTATPTVARVPLDFIDLPPLCHGASISSYTIEDIYKIINTTLLIKKLTYT